METPKNPTAILFEIKDFEAWKKWTKLLSTTYAEELKKSMEEEETDTELFISFELNGKKYGIAYLDGKALPANPNREINRIHYEKTLKCLNRIQRGQVHYSAKRN